MKKTTQTDKSLKIQRRIPQQKRAIAKYNAVLDACTQVLTKEGFAKTTILELSLESEVAVPTIYQYFTNKDAIFMAWIERVVDQVLATVTSLQKSLHHIELDDQIEILIRGALQAVKQFQQSIQQLLRGVPTALSSHLIAIIEEKTVDMLADILGTQLANSKSEELTYKLLVLVRLISGYFIQAILNEARQINIDKEARELSIIVKLYLA